MATLTKDTNNNWSGSTTLTKSSSTLNIPVGGKFVDKNISITLSVKGGSASTPATTITATPTLNTTYVEGSGYAITVSTSKSVTPSVTAGWVASGTAGTVSVTGSAYIPKAVGSVAMTAGDGSVSGSNCTLSTTNLSGVSVTGKGAVSATAKIDTAGYTPTNTSFATGASTNSKSATKYINGVTIGSGKTFTVNDGIYTWTWSIDASGNVSIT